MRVFKIMSKNARAFRTTVGMSLQQFDFLMRGVEKIYPEAEQKRLDWPGRKRGVGAGRPFSLHLWGNGTPGPDVLPHQHDPVRHDPPVRDTLGSISTNIGKIIPPYENAS